MKTRRGIKRLRRFFREIVEGVVESNIEAYQASKKSKKAAIFFIGLACMLELPGLLVAVTLSGIVRLPLSMVGGFFFLGFGFICLAGTMRAFCSLGDEDDVGGGFLLILTVSGGLPIIALGSMLMGLQLLFLGKI